MNWLYNNKEVTLDDIPTGTIGFIYKIIHLPSNQYYIGKKSIYSNRNVRIGKKELSKLKEQRTQTKTSGRLPVKKKVTKESDWKTYFSSNDWIKEQVKLGHESEFKREIIQFCKSTKSLTYWELYWQFHYNVLDDELSLNNNILGKFFRKDLN